MDFDLVKGLALAAEALPVISSTQNQAECLDFIVGRLRVMLLDLGWRYDVVDAVLAEQQHNPAGVARTVEQLAAWVARPDWNTILQAYARCVRITRDQKEIFPVDPTNFCRPDGKRTVCCTGKN